MYVGMYCVAQGFGLGLSLAICFCCTAPSFANEDWPSLTPIEAASSSQLSSLVAQKPPSSRIQSHTRSLSSVNPHHVNAHRDDSLALRKAERSSRTRTPSPTPADADANNMATQSILASLSKQNAAAAAAAAKVIEQQRAAAAAARGDTPSPPISQQQHRELRSGMDILRATSAAAATAAAVEAQSSREFLIYV